METRSMDIKLVGEILKGNNASFKTLYERYSKSHMLICLRYMRNRTDAEDALQEAYINIFRSLSQFDYKKSQFKTWSSKVVVNTCLMNLRKRNIFLDYDNIVNISENITIEQNAIDNLSLQEITNLIVQLPEGYRTVFNLYVVDGYKHKEIAEMLDISENTSKSQLMKARNTLQSVILSREYYLS